MDYNQTLTVVFHFSAVREVVHDQKVLSEVVAADDNKQINSVTNGDLIINQAVAVTIDHGLRIVYDVMNAKKPHTKIDHTVIAPAK